MTYKESQALEPKYNYDGFAGKQEKLLDLANQIVHTLTPNLPDNTQVTSLNVKIYPSGVIKVSANLRVVEYIGGHH